MTLLRFSLMVIALLMTGLSWAGEVPACLDRCDAGYLECRAGHTATLCHDRRASCVDRCDAQRLHRGTQARAHLTAGELDRTLRPRAWLARTDRD
ncbi:MAG TPA: hypothetical protein VFV27_00155 [Nevskiaceae bacterium]|nr:hypothetical protein [Nevskiaceae bacterium]